MRAGLQAYEPILMRSGLEKSIDIFYAGQTNQNRSLQAKYRAGQVQGGPTCIVILK